MSNERNEQIRKRAHEIWEREGRPHGRHDEHWQRAQEEVQKGSDDAGGVTPAGDPEVGVAMGGAIETGTGLADAGGGAAPKPRRARGASAKAVQAGAPGDVSDVGQRDAGTTGPAPATKRPRKPRNSPAPEG